MELSERVTEQQDECFDASSCTTEVYPAEQPSSPHPPMPCSHHCLLSHKDLAIRAPAMSFDAWMERTVGGNYGHCIPSAELRMKQARLDLATAQIMADPMNEEHVLYWLNKARERKDAAVSDWIRWTSKCR